MDAAGANEQILQNAGVGIEGHVVEFAEFVASFAQRSLADEFELPLGGGPFPVIGRRPEGTFVDDHDRIGPKPAQLRPFDQLSLLASPDDYGADAPLPGIHEQVADRAQLLRT
ncbi:MAG: hypothetical protein ABSE98_07395 [Acidimicrobiales bacterium]